MALHQNIVQEAAAASTAAVRVKRTRRLFRNRQLWVGGIIVGVVVFVAIFAPLVSPYGPNANDYTNLLQAPSAHHWFGTDQLGRDQLARTMIGARTSMEVSIGALVVGLVVGIPVGLVTGYYRGFLDDWLIMRIIDAIQAFPFLILALVLAAMLGPGARNAMIAIGIGYVPIFVRTVRGQVLAEFEKEYVMAARALGSTDFRIMWKHILPNSMTPLLVQATLAMASGIVAEASLSYLGLGVQPPTASWGTMLQNSQGYLGQAPWLAIVPGLAIAVSVLGFNVLGDGIQQWLDPRQGNR
ncbi:ABC transporter permease [Alicyclobacillus fastidiosus]|uniref:ABC transporter permease n=1 Tax=Alicyclobacillus fastidiosus TaxID=392011 RepID=A0ABY6ZJU5_9BACL|nr:ABC transporter permease [Alicyclobacillus fastidiosus]WAH43208.1 ABC transporter permease [Alicyclobacillus fastidiosus]GMA65241.1 ABC transporter permease [Alicyclobacillus fastidiosus]